MFLKKPTCLDKIYRVPENEISEVFGNINEEYVKNVKVVVENIEAIGEKESGFKWALVRCDDCSKKAYVRFHSGSVKNKKPDGSSRSGDMEVGKTYSVSGFASIDEMGGLVITSSFGVY